MPAIIQVASISGRIIDSAKWKVESISNLREGHGIQVSMPTNDSQLLNYIGKAANVECSVDRNKNDYSVILGCMVKQIRHMLDTVDSDLESMAVVVPSNRIVESVIVYLVDSSKSDPRFVKLIQSQASSSAVPA